MGNQQFAGNIIVANEYTLTGTGSLYAEQTIGAVAQEIKCGAAKLVGRTVVTLNAHPTNTGIIYVGIDNSVLATKYFVTLTAGEKIGIKLKSSDALGVWVYGSAAGQRIGVLETKST